jgi:deoxycytidine triphosphate deaminase
MHGLSNLLMRTISGESPLMPKLITGNGLIDAVKKQTFIIDGDEKCVEGVKYDFRVGNWILKSAYGQAVEIDKLPELERSTLRVDPGEVVFVLTKERLNLPNNMIAVLSNKRKMAHSGIMILGGSTVDPLYDKPLQVGLYNFSSTAFPLRVGKKLIAAMFYELDESELGQFAAPESTRTEGFADELVTLIRNYKPIELKGVYDELQETKRQLNELRVSLIDDKQWKEDFKRAVETHNQQLDVIIKGLDKEIASREKGDEYLRTKLDQVAGTWATFLAGFRLTWILVTALIAAVIGAGIHKAFF